MGGVEAFIAFPGCILSHLPSCSQDAPSMDLPAKPPMADATEETSKGGAKPWIPKEYIVNCYMDECPAL